MSFLPIARLAGFAAIFLVLPIGHLSAQSSPYERFEKQAWADGKIDAAERAQFEVFSQTGNLTAAKGFATQKFAAKDIEPAIQTKRGVVVNTRSWVPMTDEKANREVEPEAKKARWHHSAIVDYDGDGTQEIARLSYNGEQMAVVVDFKKPKSRRIVVWQSSEITPDVEIYSAGKRIMMNWPDLGYKVLLLYKGRPSIVHFGD